jgi:hypothetical protein
VEVDARPFGSRFLAEFRRQGGTVGRWSYATIVTLEKAGREELLSRLRAAHPTPSYATLQAGQTEEPELLAKRVVDEERAKSDAMDGSGFIWAFFMVL